MITHNDTVILTTPPSNAAAPTFSKYKIISFFAYHEDLEKREGVIWWRTRDTRARCHNRVTVTFERHPLFWRHIFKIEFRITDFTYFKKNQQNFRKQ